MPARRASRLHRAARAREQRGVALAIVVWFIAGMSLLVAGIVAQARVDTHMAQVHLGRAVAAAAGDGAIRLMMADMMIAGSPAGGELPDGRYRMGDVQARVVLLPASGLVDINAASAEILYTLFRSLGGQPEDSARLLATNMVQSRSARLVQGVLEPALTFDAIEDLLRVPGFSRALLDSVRDFIVVGEAGPGGTNWSQAPEELLGALGEMDPARADAVRARSENTPGGQAPQLTGVYRVDAIVQHGDKSWLRRRWISMTPDASSVLPWRVVRTEPPRVSEKYGQYKDG